LTKQWVEPDIRDQIVTYVQQMRRRSVLTQQWFIRKIGIRMSKFQDWSKRYGHPNFHNGNNPRSWWILSWEKEAILEYCRDRISEGYRRLTYKMIDEDIAAVSPATVYRILKANGLLYRWNPGHSSSKGNGFKQPTAPNEHWHMDIAYINVMGTFMFLISVLDGYSRMIVHHELRTTMTEYDVQITIQRALEKYPGVHPHLISDNGKQFVAKDFREFLRDCGLKQIRTSVYYPQSNGKIERFHGTIKSEAIRKQSYLSPDDARRKIEGYIKIYNEERLHSAIGYLTPKEVFEGKMNQRLAERQNKLDQAMQNRVNLSLFVSIENSISG